MAREIISMQKGDTELSGGHSLKCTKQIAIKFYNVGKRSLFKYSIYNVIYICMYIQQAPFVENKRP